MVTQQVSDKMEMARGSLIMTKQSSKGNVMSIDDDISKKSSRFSSLNCSRKSMKGQSNACKKSYKMKKSESEDSFANLGKVFHNKITFTPDDAWNHMMVQECKDLEERN